MAELQSGCKLESSADEIAKYGVCVRATICTLMT